MSKETPMTVEQAEAMLRKRFYESEQGILNAALAAVRQSERQKADARWEKAIRNNQFNDSWGVQAVYVDTAIKEAKAAP